MLSFASITEVGLEVKENEEKGDVEERRKTEVLST